MGCDGGTIPKRHELVRTKKKPEEKDKEADRASKWQYCALSNQPLKMPIVACELGRLYNKDAILEYLLDKQTATNDKVKHIKGLKDVHTLTLASNPDWVKQNEKGDGYIDTHRAQYICPVAGIEMNGKFKFAYLLTCSCVLSERALKQVRSKNCPSCSKEYSKDNDIITINGTEEEKESLLERMQRRKELAKEEKKKQKKQKKKNKDTIAEDTIKINGCAKLNGASTSNGIGTKKSVKSLTSSGTVEGAKHKLKEEKIYQTEAFKSLFTSHSSAKRAKDSNGHWITYNPYHYAG